jgi:Peptidase inhibitor I78 family
MQWRTVLLATVLAAACITCACRETTPTSPGSVAEDGSSQSPSGPAASPRRPRPPTSPPPPPASGTCDHTKVQWAIGRAATNELLERARVGAGARSARFLRPNQPVTMEYLGSRLNLGLDDQGVVRSVVCG